ncbi:MAG: putative acetyltransferase [Paracoccaceae bacterium]|jgi:putative acetyltransferase
MNMTSIQPADPRDPRATALLQASHSLMASLYPAEANHCLSVNALCAPHIGFFVAQQQDEYLGCIALAQFDGYCEIKSMFVDPAARGKAVGTQLLDRVEVEAGVIGVSQLNLETGDTLYAAHRLYARQGFAICGPFGNYVEARHSVFMQKQL